MTSRALITIVLYMLSPLATAPSWGGESLQDEPSTIRHQTRQSRKRLWQAGLEAPANKAGSQDLRRAVRRLLQEEKDSTRSIRKEPAVRSKPVIKRPVVAPKPIVAATEKRAAPSSAAVQPSSVTSSQPSTAASAGEPSKRDKNAVTPEPSETANTRAVTEVASAEPAKKPSTPSKMQQGQSVATSPLPERVKATPAVTPVKLASASDAKPATA